MNKIYIAHKYLSIFLDATFGLNKMKIPSTLDIHALKNILATY